MVSLGSDDRPGDRLMIDPEHDSAVALTIRGLMKVPKLAGFDTRTDRCERCDRWGVGLPGTPLVWFWVREGTDRA